MRWWLSISAVVLAVILAIGAWAGRDTLTTAEIGTSYVAKQTCSCMFVSRRPADACSRDFDAAAVRQLTVQPAASSVTVTALGGLFSARAEYEEGFGCHLVN